MLSRLARLAVLLASFSIRYRPAISARLCTPRSYMDSEGVTPGSPQGAVLMRLEGRE